MNQTRNHQMTYGRFKTYMDAINALKHKIDELGERHPLVNHYYKMIDELQYLPFDIYQDFYVRWSMANRYNKAS